MNNSFEYKTYLKSLGNFMVENGYTVSPLPKVILDNSEQDPVFGYTGYFDPVAKGVRLFINGRKPKDVLRTFAISCCVLSLSSLKSLIRLI